MDKVTASAAKQNFGQVLERAATAPVGFELLAHKARQKKLLTAARSEVQRWAAQRLCSQDYIERWSEWLSLPVADMVERMCSDADGWGTAMRQNSPFAAALR